MFASIGQQGKILLLLQGWFRHVTLNHPHKEEPECGAINAILVNSQLCILVTPEGIMVVKFKFYPFQVNKLNASFLNYQTTFQGNRMSAACLDLPMVLQQTTIFNRKHSFAAPITSCSQPVILRWRIFSSSHLSTFSQPTKGLRGMCPPG